MGRTIRAARARWAQSALLAYGHRPAAPVSNAVVPHGDSSRRPRALPVAGALADALAADAEELAKDWLLALVDAAPLATVARLPVAELAREAPALCADAARALAADDALHDLAGGRASAAGRLSGADGPAAVSAGVEALRGVLWRAALAELRRPSPELVAAVADRLSAVCAAIASAALGAGAGRYGDPEATAPVAVVVVPGSARDTAADKHQPTRPPEPDTELRARDTRPHVADGDAVAHLAERLAARADDGRPLAVLLVELDGVEHLLAAQTGREVAQAIEAAERAVAELLRPGDAVLREALGRLWVTLPGTGPAGARAFALRVAAAVERGASHRGAPLTASVGTAVCPQDAQDAVGLLETAEDGLFAARAAGTHGGLPPAL